MQKCMATNLAPHPTLHGLFCHAPKLVENTLSRAADTICSFSASAAEFESRLHQSGCEVCAAALQAAAWHTYLKRSGRGHDLKNVSASAS
jgi:hypothetical protein